MQVVYILLLLHWYKTNTLPLLQVKMTIFKCFTSLQNDATTATLLGVIWSKNLSGFPTVYPETIVVILPYVGHFSNGNGSKNMILDNIKYIQDYEIQEVLNYWHTYKYLHKNSFLRPRCCMFIQKLLGCGIDFILKKWGDGPHLERRKALHTLLTYSIVVRSCTPYPRQLLVKYLQASSLLHFVLRSAMRSFNSFLRIMVFPGIIKSKIRFCTLWHCTSERHKYHVTVSCMNVLRRLWPLQTSHFTLPAPLHGGHLKK